MPRENSQFDFVTSSFFFRGGGGEDGGTQERLSNYGNNKFFKWRNCCESLVTKKEFYVKAKRSHLNLDKSGIGNEIPYCLSRIGTIRILL